MVCAVEMIEYINHKQYGVTPVRPKEKVSNRPHGRKLKTASAKEREIFGMLKNANG
jgi:hypothetical protein